MSRHHSSTGTRTAASASRRPDSVFTAATIVSTHGCVSRYPCAWYSRACNKHSILSASFAHRASGVSFASNSAIRSRIGPARFAGRLAVCFSATSAAGAHWSYADST